MPFSFQCPSCRADVSPLKPTGDNEPKVTSSRSAFRVAALVLDVSATISLAVMVVLVAAGCAGNSVKSAPAFNPNDGNETSKWLDDLVLSLKLAIGDQNELRIEKERASVQSELDALTGQEVKWLFHVKEVTKSHVVIWSLLGIGTGQERCVVQVRLPHDETARSFFDSTLRIGRDIPLETATALTSFDHLGIKGTIKAAKVAVARIPNRHYELLPTVEIDLENVELLDKAAEETPAALVEKSSENADRRTENSKSSNITSDPAKTASPVPPKRYTAHVFKFDGPVKLEGDFASIDDAVAACISYCDRVGRNKIFDIHENGKPVGSVIDRKFHRK